MKYWVSWWTGTSEGEFELDTPWWVSGYRGSGENSMDSVCAAIKADTENEAREIIYNSYDKRPAHLDFRFINQKGKEWSPFCDRFPKSSWMEW